MIQFYIYDYLVLQEGICYGGGTNSLEQQVWISAFLIMLLSEYKTSEGFFKQNSIEYAWLDTNDEPRMAILRVM